MKKRFFMIFYIFLIIITISPLISLGDDIDTDDILGTKFEETNDTTINNSNSNIITVNTTSSSSSGIQVPQINSRACVVLDRKTNTILYGKNETTKRKMASTTKIMTATVILESCNLDETIEISKKAAGTGGSRLGLKTGDKITIKDLLYGLMLCSGNDAAVALAEYAGGNLEEFAKLMNKKATSLGLSNTHFETPHGLDADGHYTTALELALLSNYALQNTTFAQIVGTTDYTVTINGYPKNISNTNELLGNLEGVYGIKTGFTNGANRCLVSACKRNDMDIICVVLGADTKNFRTTDSIKLINYIFDNFEPVNIKELVTNEFEKWKNENLNSFIINKGYTQNIELGIELQSNNFINTENEENTPNTEILKTLETTYVPIRKDFISSLSSSINCQTYFEAPLAEKTQIGTIEVPISDTTSFKYSIYNLYEIKHMNWSDYLFNMLKNYSYILTNSL